MRLGFIVFIATILGLIHIYTDGIYLRLVLQNKKYLKMAGVFFTGVFIFYMLKQLSPGKKHEFLQMSNEYLKTLPIDKNAMSPILNFAAGGAGAAAAAHAAPAPAEIGGGEGGRKFKRSVGDTKKRFVASRQGWRCKNCNMMLDFTYEIDHIRPLYSGGDNSVENLQALCIQCHKSKTLMDYM